MPTKTNTNVKKNDIPVVSMTAGLDIGNGDAKCKIKIDKKDPIALLVPSAVTYTASSNTPKTPTPEYMQDLANNLDAQVVGPGVKAIDEGRMFFGRRAVNSGQSLTMFNINNHVPKSQDSLSTILIDGIVASAALTSYYEDHKALPEILNVVAGIGIALPINDFLDYRDSYSQNLQSGNHVVTVRNFGKPIQVQIHYSSCVILAEGAAAQYAIRKLGPKFIQMALDRARQEGAKIDPAYTGEMLAQATNSIGIDLGDGTVNFPVITNGRINVEASSSIDKGYGTVLDEAVQDLSHTMARFDSRRALSSFMLDDSNLTMPAQKATYQVAQRAIDNHKQIFVRDIRTMFTDIFRKVGQRTQVIWVYGGGATPMKETLEPVLIDETMVGSGENIPILWMDSSYSRNLNRNGLYEAAVYGVRSNLQ